jgi:hypothetical protein
MLVIWKAERAMPITIETTAIIGEDRRLIVQLPPEVPPGIHRVRAVLDEAPPEAPSSTAPEWVFPVLANAQWPGDMPLTREELYDDDGH